jgi:DNA replication protein DnaC
VSRPARQNRRRNGAYVGAANRPLVGDDSQPDPLDFLLLLLEDELMRREFESIDRYIHRAHFAEVCDARDFDFTWNPESPEARIWELASGRFVEERASILLCGPTGVGKTFIAQALGVQICR